jgi:hypothetical protein
MNRFVLTICSLSMLLVGFAGPLWGKVPDLSKWSYMAQLKDLTIGTKGAVEFALPPKVIDLSLPHLDDLRLVLGADKELGYKIRVSKGKSQKKKLDTKLFNRSYLPGRQSSITADFGGKFLKNRIKVVTNGTNFFRKVRIEGSNDQNDWKIIREGAFLFRTEEGGKQKYDKGMVNFPDNNQRYLKVTVFTGKGDLDVIEINAVDAWYISKTLAETDLVPIVSSTTREKKKVTEISLDVGFRNLPLYELKLLFSDEYFYREVEVFGRNSLTRIVRRMVEDSPKLERSVSVPWRTITKGHVYRFTTDTSVDESPPLKLKDARYRYLLVKIRNHDDPPLHFTGATAKRLIQQVWFAGKGIGKYTLYFGNPKARRPTYDVGRYINRLRKVDVGHARLGEVMPNPAYKQMGKTLPWSERHAEIIWIVLFGMIAVLGLLIYRVAMSGRKRGDEAQE